MKRIDELKLEYNKLFSNCVKAEIWLNNSKNHGDSDIFEKLGKFRKELDNLDVIGVEVERLQGKLMSKEETVRGLKME